MIRLLTRSICVGFACFAAASLLRPIVQIAEAQSEETNRQQNQEQPSRKKRSGRSPRKEAEGTKAADRFEADTVIKSQYRYDGEQLEVDPD